MSASLDRHLLEMGFADQDRLWWSQVYTRTTGGRTLPAVWWQDRQRLTEVCEALRFSAAVGEAFVAAARRIDCEAPHWWALLALADQLYRCDDDQLRTEALRRPGPQRSQWGELADLFPALVYLTGLDAMIQAHRQRGLPEQVTRDTAQDLVARMEKFFATHGTWGTTDVRGWFTRHLRLKLFTLGRLQFEIAQFHLHVMVLTNAAGAVAVLLEPGQRMRADGQFACADHGVAEHAADNWTSTLPETDTAWRGHPVTPAGQVQRATQRFAKSAWRLAVRRGDPALTVHIPEQGRLERDACEASFALAEQFFPRYFPDRPCRAFTCTSWLMDPQLACVLDEQSNLRRFMSLFHSVPSVRGNDDQMFERVFGGRRALAELPRDTTLRRRICTELEAGRRWRTAGGLRLCGGAGGR